jgi:nucleoside-diphosphate-sugar epimerase
MNTLVADGAGMIGSHLVDALLTLGHRVRHYYPDSTDKDRRTQAQARDRSGVAAGDGCS